MLPPDLLHAVLSHITLAAFLYQNQRANYKGLLVIRRMTMEVVNKRSNKAMSNIKHAVGYHFNICKSCVVLSNR